MRRILSVRPGDGLQAWHAVTQWFKPRSVVEQAASMARLISPKRTKNVNELQIAVMQWELALVEHESKFSEVVADSVKTVALRAMLPKDVLGRFLDGPFIYEELRNRVSAHVGEGWPDRTQAVESNPEDEDVNAVQQRRPHDRFNQKYKRESDNKRKLFNRQTTNSSPPASRQSTSRDKKSGRDERSRMRAREGSHLLQVWWKGPSCQALPVSG